MKAEKLFKNQELFLEELSSFLGVENRWKNAGFKSNSSHSPRFSKLNYVMNKSSIKGLIRNILPDKIIEYGKEKFYKEPQPLNLTSYQCQRLKEYFQEYLIMLSRKFNIEYKL